MFTRVGRLFAGVRLRLYTCIGNVSQKWVARNERINILTVMAYTFLLSDESVNSYGTRVLTAGIRLDDYEKNPVVLWNHTRAWSDREDQILPIGKIVKIWKDGDKLYGDIEFDSKDAFAVKVANKVEQGIIRACSVNISVVTTSEDESVLVQGQTRPTVVESRLREVSVVDIPANKNCVRLFDDGTGAELGFADGQDSFLLPLLKSKKMNLKDEILSALELKDADERAVVAEIVRLRGEAKAAETLRQENGTLKDELKGYRDKEEDARKAAIADLVDGAIKARKIAASDRTDYITLAEKDFERTKKVLEAMPGVKELKEDEELKPKDLWAERFREIENNCKQ